MAWSDVDWTAAETIVRRLQNRIFRAAREGDGAKVKSLQNLLARSRSAKLLAIRQVTQQNDRRETPGIDGVVCRTPSVPMMMRHRPPRKFRLEGVGELSRGHAQ